MAQIRSYGLYWDYRLVEWDDYWIYGWKLNNDTWREPPSEAEVVVNAQRAVYLLHAADRSVVYVGQSGGGQRRLGQRLWDHTRNSRRGLWTHFSWFGLNEPVEYAEDQVSDQLAVEKQVPPDNYIEESSNDQIASSLNIMEALLIDILNPPLNRRRGNWNGATKYQQYSYSELTTLDDLWSKQKKMMKRIKKIQKSVGKPKKRKGG